MDTAVLITGLIAWMGLAAITVLFLAIVLWLIFGAFTEKASGSGLIIDSAGVVNISPATSGKVTNIYVQSGNVIHAGDLIANMDRSEQTADKFFSTIFSQ